MTKGEQLDGIVNLEFNKGRYIPCGECIVSKNNNLLGKFRFKILWLISPNSYYEETLKMEFPNEFYKSKASVPNYYIFKNSKKVGCTVPRVSKNGDNFLIIPNTLGLNRTYYIWDVDEKYTIKEGALIYFDISTDKKIDLVEIKW